MDGKGTGEELSFLSDATRHAVENFQNCVLLQPSKFKRIRPNYDYFQQDPNNHRSAVLFLTKTVGFI